MILLASIGELFQDNFFWGLGTGFAIGLLLTLWVAIAGLLRRRDLRNEMGKRLGAVRTELDKLRQHLHTQMEISARGAEEQKTRLRDLEKQNENLRVTVKTLQQKPDRISARTLEVWQRAVDSMNSRAPGFAGAWQEALRQAEDEVGEMENGLKGWMRKFLGARPASLPEPAGKRGEGEKGED